MWASAGRRVFFWMLVKTNIVIISSLKSAYCHSPKLWLDSLMFSILASMLHLHFKKEKAPLRL